MTKHGAARLAASKVTRTGVESVAARYLSWLDSKAATTAAINALLGAAETSKDPSRVLTAADTLYESMDDFPDPEMVLPGYLQQASLSAAYARLAQADVSLIPGGRKIGFMGASVTNGASSSNASIASYQALTAVVAGTQKVRRWGESINGGVAGENSTQIAARVQGVLDQGAEVLVIGPDFGTNSAGQAIPLTQFQTDVIGSVDKAKAAGVPVLVCTTLPRVSTADAAIVTLIRTYNLWLSLWAAAAGVPLVDTHATLASATGSLAAAFDGGDGIHPNDAGHLALAKAIGPALAALIRSEPWPAQSGPLTGFGMLANPLVNGTTNWSGVATGTPTSVSADAPVAGDGLPAGNWLAIRQNNSGGGSTVTSQRGATMDATRWAVGDKLLVCYHAKSNLTDGRGLKVHVLDQANTARAVLLDTPQVGNPGPRMDVFTVPSGVTALRLTLSASALAGVDATHYIGAADVFNLTQAGLTAYA